MKIEEILASPEPGRALRQSPEAWPHYFDLAPSISAGPAPFHTGSVLDHACRVMDAVAGDPAAVWMALAHDAGKLLTPRSMLPHHYGHEARGARRARAWGAELGLGEDLAQAGELAALWHMRAGRYLIMRPGKQRSLLLEVHSSPFADAFWKVVDADSRSCLGVAIAQDWRLLRAAINAGLSDQGQIQAIHKHGLSALLKRSGKMGGATA